MSYSGQKRARPLSSPSGASVDSSNSLSLLVDVATKAKRARAPASSADLASPVRPTHSSETSFDSLLQAAKALKAPMEELKIHEYETYLVVPFSASPMLLETVLPTFKEAYEIFPPLRSFYDYCARPFYEISPEHLEYLLDDLRYHFLKYRAQQGADSAYVNTVYSTIRSLIDYFIPQYLGQLATKTMRQEAEAAHSSSPYDAPERSSEFDLGLLRQLTYLCIHYSNIFQFLEQIEKYHQTVILDARNLLTECWSRESDYLASYPLYYQKIVDHTAKLALDAHEPIRKDAPKKSLNLLYIISRFMAFSLSRYLYRRDDLTLRSSHVFHLAHDIYEAANYHASIASNPATFNSLSILSGTTPAPSPAASSTLRESTVSDTNECSV